MREIVLDTESTGLDPQAGHRLVEIGCVELYNHIPTGKTYHQYINPERDMPSEAFNVHGLSEDFLQQFPIFSAIFEDFLLFLGDAPLIIHNAAFDIKFINAELALCGRDPVVKNEIVDTLDMARKKFPGAPASLDALCRRYKIDNTQREQHGALLDAELLAQVYLELLGGKQKSLFEEIISGPANYIPQVSSGLTRTSLTFVPSRKYQVSAEEEDKHQKFISEKIPNSLWRQ